MESFCVLDAMQRGFAGIVKAAANKALNTIACDGIAHAAVGFGGPGAVVHRARLELPWLRAAGRRSSVGRRRSCEARSPRVGWVSPAEAGTRPGIPRQRRAAV